jgi:hypothetical protein
VTGSCTADSQRVNNIIVDIYCGGAQSFYVPPQTRAPTALQTVAPATQLERHAACPWDKCGDSLPWYSFESGACTASRQVVNNTMVNIFCGGTKSQPVYIPPQSSLSPSLPAGTDTRAKPDAEHTLAPIFATVSTSPPDPQISLSRTPVGTAANSGSPSRLVRAQHNASGCHRAAKHRGRQRSLT